MKWYIFVILSLTRLSIPTKYDTVGVSVQEDYTRSDTDFGITLEDLFIDLKMSGTDTYLNSRTPTPEHLESLPQIMFTSDIPWNPKEVHYNAQHHVYIFSLRGGANTHQLESYETDIPLSHVSSILNEQQLYRYAVSSVIVNQGNYVETNTSIASLQSQERHSVVTPEQTSHTYKLV